jgi:hypothetical protein
VIFFDDFMKPWYRVASQSTNRQDADPVIWMRILYIDKKSMANVPNDSKIIKVYFA